MEHKKRLMRDLCDAIMLNYAQNTMDMTIEDKIPTEFYCNCSKERVSRAVVSVGKKELTDMIEEGKPIEVNCHFCNTNYNFSVEELKKLL